MRRRSALIGSQNLNLRPNIGTVLLQHLAALQRAATVERYVIHDRMNPFRSYNNEEFVARYRVTKECVTELLETIRHSLAIVHNRGSPSPPHLQLTIALRYMTTGNFQPSMANCSGVPQSSVSTCVSTIAARLAELAPRHIRFPEPNNEKTIMSQFSVIAGMTGW
ncbi:putative nuclease HARBI1 [Penaeus vannamei]|uniref:putative nuclease HARBI1 n=1 Tax=Penaeus vannamei TaxID=6689 RepID=UPI00387F3B4D